MNISEYFRLAIKNFVETLPRGSQKKIAEKIGVDRSYLNQFLKGKRTISENARVKLSEYFGCKYEELISLGRDLSDFADAVQEQEKIFTDGANPNFYKLIREKNGYTTEDIAKLLDIPESEYVYKEKKIAPFTFREISILISELDNIELQSGAPVITKKMIEIKEQVTTLSEEDQEIFKIYLLEESSAKKKKFNYIYQYLQALSQDTI